MMKMRFAAYLPSLVCSTLVLLVTNGCINDHVVFTTSTKFALDISQQADQPPKVLLGYKREEGVFLPSPHKPGTTKLKENVQKQSHAPKPENGNQPSPAPVQATQSASEQETRNDTYSVVSFICVMANPSLWDAIKGLAPFDKNEPDGLQIHSVFATGVAAQHVSESKEVRDFYRQAAAQMPERAEKRCF